MTVQQLVLIFELVFLSPLPYWLCSWTQTRGGWKSVPSELQAGSSQWRQSNQLFTCCSSLLTWKAWPQTDTSFKSIRWTPYFFFPEWDSAIIWGITSALTIHVHFISWCTVISFVLDSGSYMVQYRGRAFPLLLQIMPIFPQAVVCVKLTCQEKLHFILLVMYLGNGYLHFA